MIEIKAGRRLIRQGGSTVGDAHWARRTRKVLRRGQGWRGEGAIRKNDAFALFNTAIFALMLQAVYFDRFVAGRGAANLHEFFFYACALLAITAVVWLSLRRTVFPTWMLVLMQAGILIHFAGGVVMVDGARLYDFQVLGLGYDKYVHFINAFAGSVLIDHVMYPPGRRRGRAWTRAVVVLMVVLGAGSVVEMLEYMVTTVLPNSGVGDYGNNMQDLVANLAGGLTFGLWRGLSARAAAPAQARAA